MKKKNIIIFASGAGSNAEKIILHSKKSALFRVCLVVTNKPNAGVIKVAHQHKVPCNIIHQDNLTDQTFMASLAANDPCLIVLAGFLSKIPLLFLNQFQNKVVNIHPSLLPKYGGKGMYGKHVHEAVWANQEKESGITIHWVNEEYDKGAVVVQKKESLDNCRGPEDVAKVVRGLEHKWYPLTIENLIEDEF